MARLSWTGSLLAGACAVALMACDGGASNTNGGNGGDGGSGGDATTSGTSNGGNGTGGSGTGGSSAPPVFEDDIVPIFQTTCGSGDNNCHARVAYAATANSDCRGWLSLEDAAIGSQIYGGPMDGQPTMCPDMPLYERLTQLLAWEECSGVAKKYIVPCDVDASYLFDKIDDGPYCGDPATKQMPPGVLIDPVKKETIRAWILAGAPRKDGTKTDCGGMKGAAPMATITHPGDMETRPPDMAIPFIGSATDAEDGDLTGQSLVWTSDLTGDLGTGTMFDAPLSLGTHKITLTATDSDGNTGTDSITLFIVAP